MKVLQINATCEHGSTGLIVKDIGNELTALGHQVFYAYQLAKNPVPNGYRIGKLLDWKIHALFSRVFGKQAYYSRLSTKRLLKWIDEIKPDVVHLHNLHSNYINLNMVLKYLATNKIPTVVTLHDCWYFTGKCFHYVDVGCEGYKSGCKACKYKKTAPVSWFFSTAKKVYKDRVKHFSAIDNLKFVGCSEWISGEAKKSFLKDFDIRTIQNGVNIDIFKPLDKQELKTKFGLQDKFVILGIAQKLMVPANAELIEKIVDSLDENCVFVVIGCSTQQKEMLSAYGKKVIAKGFVEHRHEMAEYYSLADVFVNPSHADTLPTVSMESICCGTPVVTYNNSGCPELILDGCGEVVDDCDADKFIEAICRVKNTQYACSKIGQEHFDRSLLVCKYIDLYREMLN